MDDNQTAPRAAIAKMIGENKESISGQMENFWRRWVEDLVAGGVCEHAVVEAMLVVAMTQCVKIAGTTVTSDYLQRCVDKIRDASDAGVEFLAADVVRH